jgi:hypothetical protein
MVSQKRAHAIRGTNRLERPSYVFTDEALKADIRLRGGTGIDAAVNCLSRCAAIVLVICSTASCGVLRGWLSHDDSEQRAAEMEEVQLRVMRFADEYSGRIANPIQRFQVAAASAEERLAAQNWRLAQATAAYTIASGPNPFTNALDMIVLATLSRMVLEDHWVEELYGDRALHLQEIHRELESQAWQLTEGVLDADQVTLLHEMIDEWRAEHPKVRAVAHIHFSSFAKAVSPEGSSQGGGGLFALIGLDPLHNLYPAVREITQTRQLAERSIYYLQRAPDLLDMQIERLTYQFAVMPEIKSVLVNADRFGLAAESTGELFDHLPAAFASEREATLRQLGAMLSAQQGQLRELLIDMRATLEAGTDTASAVQGALSTARQLTDRTHNQRDAQEPSAMRGRPFDITEYTAAARELSATANELQALIREAAASTDEVSSLAAVARRDAEALVDHTFWRLLQLLGLFFLLVVLTLAVNHKLKRSSRSPRTHTQGARRGVE